MRKGFLILQLLLFGFFFFGASIAFASDWRALKSKALELAIQGEDDDAHMAYEQAISKAKDQFGESAPFIGELYFEMGEMDLAAKKFSWADGSLSQACRLMPNSPSAHLKLAELFLLQDRSSEARAQAALVLQKHKDCLAARQLLATSYSKQGNEAKSVKEFFNYTIGAAVGPILPSTPESDASAKPDETKPKPKSSVENKQGKPEEKAAKSGQNKAQEKSSPAAAKTLMQAHAASLLKSKQAKHEDTESEGALMPPTPVAQPKAPKDKSESHKGKSKAHAKAPGEAQAKKAKAAKASSKAKARSAETEVIPLKAKPAQLKLKQKGMPRGLVPPPPPMVPSFGGFVPPPPPAVAPAVESHPKAKAKEIVKESPKEAPKESAKETAKESSKETSKASSKEGGSKEQAHSGNPGEGSDFLLDWAGPKKKGH